MSEEIWKILSVIILSSVKFLFGGIPLAFFYNFSISKVIVTTSTGGIIGVFVFYYLSLWLLKTGKSFVPQRKNKKTFTWKNKLIVKTKNKLGLGGLAILTPTIISLPLGLLLATRYYKKKSKILIYMSLAVVICSAISSTIKLLF